jgi:hypothetical protein
VAAGVSGSRDAAAWQRALVSEFGRGTDTATANHTSNSTNDSNDANAGGSSSRGSHVSGNGNGGRGVFFAIDVFGTVGNQMVEKLLARAARAQSQRHQVQQRPEALVGVDVSADGSAAPAGASEADDWRGARLPAAPLETGAMPAGPWAAAGDGGGGCRAKSNSSGAQAWSAWSLPYLDLGPPLGRLRLVTVGCGAARERYERSRGGMGHSNHSSNASSDRGSGSGEAAASRPRPSRRQPCGDLRGKGARGAARYAAATGVQLAAGAADLCAEPWARLHARLAVRKGENPLKVERLCFGAAFVLELLAAYGLLRTDPGCETASNDAASAHASGSGRGDHDQTACESSGGGGARVVFAESFGDLEASWALGALVHRLLVEPPP